MTVKFTQRLAFSYIVINRKVLRIVNNKEEKIGMYIIIIRKSVSIDSDTRVKERQDIM